MNEAMILHAVICILIGIFAGLMAGMFGIGGGLVVVPSLVFIFHQTQLIPENIIMYVAVGTSLAAMIITATASVKAHYKIDNILWPIFHKLWPALTVGTLIGSLVAAWIPTQWLTFFFAIFLLCMAIKTLTDAQVSHLVQFPKQWINFLTNFLIGTNSGLLGVGGGILIVPYLIYCGVEVRKIAAISNLSALTIALVGTIAFMITGYQKTITIAYTTGYVYWPAVILIGIASSLMAPIGVRLNYRLPVYQLRYSFVLILILTAINMLFKGI